jgi:predicted component of type VI protein secretion system
MSMKLVWERSRDAVEFPLDATAPLTVGREDDADIQIAEPLVSRLHARLERRGEAWFVIDLGSTNLTRVNGVVVREKQLRPGDEVQFARATCRFVEGDRAADKPMPDVAGTESGETPRAMPTPPRDGSES